MSEHSTIEKHRFITIDVESFGRKHAEERVMEALNVYMPGISKSRLKNKNEPIPINDGKGKQTVTSFDTLVAGTTQSGIVPEIDRILWRNTAPSGTIRAATEASNFPDLVLGTGHRASDALQPPGCITNDVLSDILEDILFYRQEVARTSSIEDGFRSSFRAYRAYLVACITSIDTFLNYHRWFFVNDAASLSRLSDKEIKIIQNVRLPISRKLSEWIPILSGGHSLKDTLPPWQTYNAIREERNAFVHVNDPDYLFALEHTSKALNYCRSGVGQLLLDAYKLLGQNPLPRVYAIRYVPMARFVPK